MMADMEKRSHPAYGATTIAPGVLITIAKMTALSVDGVASVAPIPGGVNRWFRRGETEGIRLHVDENAVAVDLHLILESGTDVRAVCRKVQSEVARAIEDMVGMEVQRIDVHVEDIFFQNAAT
jgi:uncharacterized alkaline shock family protein YloU